MNTRLTTIAALSMLLVAAYSTAGQAQFTVETTRVESSGETYFEIEFGLHGLADTLYAVLCLPDGRRMLIAAPPRLEDGQLFGEPSTLQELHDKYPEGL